MLPDPLHPAIVHLPVALAFLQPLLVILALVAMGKKFLPERLWIGIVILQGILFVGMIVAKETGEDQEHRVEEAIGHDAIHEHEERAELLTILGGIALGTAGLGLFRGRLGLTGRVLTLALSLGVMVVAGLTGKTGGELVYKHGAARVYWQEVETEKPK